MILTSFSVLAVATPSEPTNTSADQYQNNHQNNPSTRARQTPEVKVYFHEDNALNTLDTIPGNKTQLNPSITTLSDQDEVQFDLDPALMGDLSVEGSSIGTSAFGFWIYIQIFNPPTNSQAQITFTIKDDETVIARNSNPINIPSGQDTRNQYPLEVPFVQSSKSEHSFNVGSVIKILINVSLTGPAPIVVTYDRGENDGYMLLTCNPIAKKSVSAFHSDGTGGVFYPNLPNSDQRVMMFRGSVTDKFGAYDISEVRIDLENVFSQPEAAPYVYNENEAEGYFELNYEYDKGLPPTDYLITAYIEDNSGNTHIATSSLTISKYGVYMECTNNSGYGYPSEVVEFRINVYNVGGNSDSISLTATPTPKSWNTAFKGGDTTGVLSPGDNTIKTLQVTVPTSAQKNDKCYVTVIGRSVNDPSPTPSEKESFELDPEINVVARAEFNFNFEINSDAVQVVDKGNAAVFDFKLWNTGSETDSYTVSVNDQPLSGNDWTAQLTTSSSGAVKVSNLEYKITLQQTKIADFTLTVNSPDSGEPEQMELSITATSSNITDTNLKSKTIKTTTNIKGIIPPGKIELDADSQTKKANPGDSIDQGVSMDIMFEITTLNEDDNYDYYVELAVKGIPGTWTYSLTSTDFTVSASDSKDVSLILSILETEASGSYSFKIEASFVPENMNGGGSDQPQTTSLDLAVTIPRVVDVLLESKETELTTEVDKEIEYLLTVTYLGNVKNIDMELKVTPLSGWDVTLSMENINFEEYGDVKNVKLTVKPTESADEDEKGIVEVSMVEKDTGDTIGNKIPFKTTIKKDSSKEVADFFISYPAIIILVIAIVILSIVVWRRQREEII
jgi:uncharacterized membrane protein